MLAAPGRLTTAPLRPERGAVPVPCAVDEAISQTARQLVRLRLGRPVTLRLHAVNSTPPTFSGTGMSVVSSSRHWATQDVISAGDDRWSQMTLEAQSTVILRGVGERHRSGSFSGDSLILRLQSMESSGTARHPEVSADSPLSSASLRYSLSRTVAADGPGPSETRPFGLRFAQRVPSPVRPEVCYCHQRQVAVDDAGRPLIERMGWEEDQKKEWESKTYSDGDEGQEEDTWGWEEEH